ncbi:MAG: WD40/YVTN/BNR-like repeat-containing protein, partial [Candidatus Acidiferrales bacterium]
DPTTYYMATPGGGVWKTTDAGEVWFPIFDAEHVSSVGAIAVAPSDPKIIYVGTGEQTAGHGVYKSTDAGATWTNIGLEEMRFISSILVDPRNPDVIVVGVLGHPLLSVSPPSPDRGIYKTTDGGKTWKKTLYKDDLTGVADLCAEPGNPRVLYASLWHPTDFFAGEGAPEKPNSWIYKSTDQGSTWKELAYTGFPKGPWDRIGIAVAPGNHGQRVFAIFTQGLYRSDDAGATWRQITQDTRVIGNAYFARVFVDPRNADLVYVMQTSLYRSTDGGQTFASYKGAPGGDDYHNMWIDPQNSQRLILGVDQGAVISVDGGKTWTSWHNQPTGQFYHVSTDNNFPYIAYAAQQDSGTAEVPSRSDYGSLTYRDWFSAAGFEYSYIAPDPLNPNIVYSGGWYGSVVRFDRTTGQYTHAFVRGPKYRTTNMPPLVFSPRDPHVLYFATQFVMQTSNAGKSWQEISPDLTKRTDEPAKSAEDRERSQTQATEVAQATPASRHDSHQTEDQEPRSAAVNPGHAPDAESFTPFSDDEKDFGDEQSARRRHAVSTLAVSPLQAGVMWAGTNNGLIQLTQDGGLNWKNVSPPDLTPTSNVVILEASPWDSRFAYATVENRRDQTPYIYRTRDNGNSWQKITAGLPATWIARAIREDTVRKGLLYAALENGVYVSFDGGDNWQSLQLNLPTSDARDLAIHGNDLVVATYGRALWILDDLSPLRQASAQIANTDAALLQPATVTRVRWDNDQETPLPPEFPAGQNPPDGAIIYYTLKSAPSADITLEIHDAQGNLVRTFSSAKPAPDTVVKNVPDYWFGPQIQLPKNAGLNRFAWDLRYEPPPSLQYSYYGEPLKYLEYTLSDHAIPGETPREQVLGPIVAPGQYQITLIANGQKLGQSLTIVPDPRVHISAADYQAQFAAAKRADSGLRSSYAAFQSIAILRAAVSEREKNLDAALKANPQSPDPGAKAAAEAMKYLDKQITEILECANDSPGVGGVNRDLARTSFMIESGDAAPSDTAEQVVTESCAALNKSIAAWRALNTSTLPSVNAVLENSKLARLPIAPIELAQDQDACHL